MVTRRQHEPRLPLRRKALVPVRACMLTLSLGCGGASTRSTLSTEAPAVDPDAVELVPLVPGTWMHVSFREIDGYGRVRSNGLVSAVDGNAYFIDSAWTPAQTRQLLRRTRSELDATPVAAVATHAHADKMGGMQAYRDAGLETYALAMSNIDAQARQLIPAKHDLGINERVRGAPFVLFYPGPGHTRDNIVAYLPEARLLFGGCLIRPADSVDLGNIADADIPAWAHSVRHVAKRFPLAETVVPSHGPPGDRKLLAHTIHLAEHASHH